MNTADDDPSLIRQKILRHAHKVRFVEFWENFIKRIFIKTNLLTKFIKKEKILLKLLNWLTKFIKKEKILLNYL